MPAARRTSAAGWRRHAGGPPSGPDERSSGTINVGLQRPEQQNGIDRSWSNQREATSCVGKRKWRREGGRCEALGVPLMRQFDKPGAWRPRVCTSVPQGLPARKAYAPDAAAGHPITGAKEEAARNGEPLFRALEFEEGGGGGGKEKERRERGGGRGEDPAASRSSRGSAWRNRGRPRSESAAHPNPFTNPRRDGPFRWNLSWCPRRSCTASRRGRTSRRRSP
jgi:hypothetical protein